MIAKLAQSGNSIIFVNDDAVMHIAPREAFTRFCTGDLDTFAFHIKRMATEDGFLKDDRFDESDVYFVDRNEDMTMDEALDIIGGEDEVAEALRKDDERVDKRDKYGDLDF